MDIKNRTMNEDIKNGDNKDIQLVVDQLIKDAYELLPDIIKKTKDTDEKQKKIGVNWTERHRLQVLLEAAENSSKGLPYNITAPWFLIELRITLDLIRKWKKEDIWVDIEPSLKNPTHFNHTILKLIVVESFKIKGHEVKIVPRKESSSPDLMLNAIGGKQELVYIECYQPIVLSGEVKDITKHDGEIIIKKAMDKAKQQLNQRKPGILAICGYNQSVNNIALLESLIKDRLQKTKRPHLAGILLVILSIKSEFQFETTSFNSIINSYFIPNPSYFGSVNFRLDALKTISKDVINNQIKLKIISKFDIVNRSILFSTIENFHPFFKGAGNVDYLCGKCNTIIGKNIWYYSISNLIIHCPNCKEYNEFPKISNLDFEWVLIPKVKIDITKTLEIFRNIQVMGQ